NPSRDWLIRHYVQGICEFARRYYPGAVPGDVPAGPLVFASGPAIEPILDGDSRAGEADQTLHLDFRNYTLGRLVSGRRNYDMKHAGHVTAVAHVRGVVWALGWRTDTFAAIDRSLAESRHYHREGKVDRYGKKYCWIGFFAYARQLAVTSGLPSDDRPEVDLDPSFPERPPPVPFRIPTWVSRDPADDLVWLRTPPDVPAELLCPNEIDGATGPWVVVYTFLNADDPHAGRDAFGRGIALLVDSAAAAEFVTAFNSGSYGVDMWIPEDYYTFAGEIPWGPEFCRRNEEYSETPYFVGVALDGTEESDAETLAHYFSWEEYHSPLNAAAPAVVPSRSFSAAFDLRGAPQSFNQREPDGRLGAISLGAPDGISGTTLYLRKDLLDRYAAGRTLIWLMSGERRLLRSSHVDQPQLGTIYSNGENEWRIARVLSGSSSTDVTPTGN
ncbi:MAG: hypothetical protein ABGY75_17640, partial [Gemmataceae bacterium]